MSTLAAYSPAQIARYFDRLGLPQEQRIQHVASLDATDALGYLARLQTLHLAEIPFENISLHYSTHHSVSVHPHQLFKKIIADNNGRGGYCMENNALFGTLLRSLGFTVYPGGGRVFTGTAWTGWSHMINIVTIGDTKYHVDVGFGGDAPTAPMALDRTGTVHKSIQPASARLQWRNIPGNTDPSQRLWVYEYRRSDDCDWEMKYSFTELEFLPEDFALINYFTSTSRHTWFTRMIVADKKIVGPDGELIGKMTLAATTLKWNIRGEKTKEIEFKSEADRIEALEKYFGIKLDQAERDSIAGLASEIK
ncbi:arylamine N-acetyltransferase 1 [Curvularia clavata]|uniref:Arylamine N-acetyltransferase 1 n=1 Tax=Curvularia clavata TaxID=95742 RepID=A0A9Q8ZDQ6_CURCL|nr:arylamine N-acetyltransferase 1 [Curvularia clavata]